jgi:hypothetical protein
MSAHGRDGHSQRPGPGQRSGQRQQPHRAGDSDGVSTVGWALLVIAAALIGGLAAAALVHVSLIIAVIVALVAGGIAVAVFRSPGRPRPVAYPVAGSAAPAPAAPVGAAPVTAAAPVTRAAPANAPGHVTAGSPAREQTDTAVQLLPLPADNSSRPGPPPAWWDAAQGAPPPSSQAAQRTPAPDLSTYLASTFIAQCPRCGAFRLDIARARSGWDFHCESCEYVWTWQPGTPWPPVRVMPGRRKESRPPPA